jgi:hypothetical protein
LEFFTPLCILYKNNNANSVAARRGSGHALRRVLCWRTGIAVHGVTVVLSAAVILSAAKDLA